jgi:hypothetical protein
MFAWAISVIASFRASVISPSTVAFSFSCRSICYTLKS